MLFTEFSLFDFQHAQIRGYSDFGWKGTADGKDRGREEGWGISIQQILVELTNSCKVVWLVMLSLKRTKCTFPLRQSLRPDRNGIPFSLVILPSLPSTSPREDDEWGRDSSLPGAGGQAFSDLRIDLKRTQQLQISRSLQGFLFYLSLNKYFTLPLPFIFLSGCGYWKSILNMKQVL